jgi:hypothetical protein
MEMDWIVAVARSRGWLLFACVGLAVSSLWSCLVAEGDAACGEHQQQVSEPGTLYCLCEPGFVIDDDDIGCKACGENEDSDGRTCTCKPGFTRPLGGGECMMTSLGAACSSDEECAGDFPICVVDGADSYCTSDGCASSADCQPNWFCDADGDGSVCRKPPAGYRQPCDGADDCAGTAATYCDSFQSHSCLIQGCGKGAPCPGDWSCCDISLIGVSLCIEPSGLTDGACPAGGTLVLP